MTRLTKQQFIDEVASKTGLTKTDTAKTVDAVLNVVSGNLAKGNQVALTGFGTFLVSQRSARKGVNPQTGKEIDIPARTVPAFKAGKGLKDAVN